MGRPAVGVSISLDKAIRDREWETLSEGTTDQDGRVGDLVSEGVNLMPGIYRLVFDSGNYYKQLGIASFYPYVTVVFEIRDTEHYHVPLLLNPHGYSTYRGS